jgi:4-amino-4-deoxy-L-arabinose transferase-like glycosyltransferase
MNYYQDNNNFFAPAVHHLGRDGTGKTVSDFPVIYFTVAQFWKLFGQQEFILRGINLLIFFVGLISLFRVLETVLKDSFIAMSAVALLFTSPILIYYANNFLMDVPAFSIALIGLYFFTKFYYTKKNKYLVIFAVFYALAGLLKISSMIGFIAISILFILEALGVKLKENGRIFSEPLKQSLVFAGVYMLLFTWYIYARSYNEKYNAGNFLLGILPFWDFNYAQITEILNSVTEHIKWSYFRRETQVLYVLMLIFILINHRKTNRILLYTTILIVLGFAGFIILFFQALAHDYYVTNMLILVPVILLTFMLLLKTSYPNIFYSFIFRLALVLFLVHNIDFAGRRITDRYSPDGWQNSNYTKNVHIFEEITPYLRSIGIQKNDRIISLSDNSINITLYLMNQKGWTNYGLDEDSTQISKKIALGAKYLMIYDKRTYQNSTILPFLKNKIGEYKSVDIYRL